jgi:hypothetical protein
MRQVVLKKSRKAIGVRSKEHRLNIVGWKSTVQQQIIAEFGDPDFTSHLSVARFKRVSALKQCQGCRADFG